jgi:hypothetical protein
MKSPIQQEKAEMAEAEMEISVALLFTAKGLRKFPIEYFQPTEITKARAWLMEKT